MIQTILATQKGDKGSLLAYSSPMEVQYGGTNLTDGTWLSATMRAVCADGGNTDLPHGGVEGSKVCTQAINR
jgi:hypothetical protein